MIIYIVKFIFLIFWILSVLSSVYFFYLTTRAVTGMEQLIGFAILYTFIIIASTIVSFSVLFFDRNKNE